MTTLVDTSALIRPNEDILNNLTTYRSSMICRAELVRGLMLFRDDPARSVEAVDRADLIRDLDIIPQFWTDFDLPASKAYGELLVNPPDAARLKDALIAAHAMTMGGKLITRDKGFTRFAQLDLTVLEDEE